MVGRAGVGGEGVETIFLSFLENNTDERNLPTG